MSAPTRRAAVLTLLGACALALSAIGVRLVFWLAALSPFWMSFRFTALDGVTPEERVRYVDRLVHHKFKLISELMLLIKLAASMALLGMVIVGLTEVALPALMKPLLDGTFVYKDAALMRWMPAVIIGAIAHCRPPTARMSPWMPATRPRP